MPYILEEEHFTVEDIANARGITVQAVRKAIAESRLSAKKIAGSWFVTKSELQERGWLKRENN